MTVTVHVIFLSLAVVLVSPGLDKYVIVPVTVALPFPTAVKVHPVFAPLDTFTTFSLLLVHVIFVIILPASVNVAVRPIAFALLIVLLYKAAVCGTVTDALAAAAAFTQFNVYAVVPAATLIFVEPSASLYPCAS